MRALSSLLHAAQHEQQQASSPAADMAPVGLYMVVVLASLLCTLICFLGLFQVCRCACRLRLRRRDSQQQLPPPPPPRGLKKEAIDALPTFFFTTATSPSPAARAPPVGAAPAPLPCPDASMCAICLADFAEGETLRVLPRCGHGFHVACVDTWLRARATCPSCRAVIIAETTPAQAPPVVAPGACGRRGPVLLPSAPGAAAAGYDTFLP